MARSAALLLFCFSGASAQSHHNSPAAHLSAGIRPAHAARLQRDMQWLTHSGSTLAGLQKGAATAPLLAEADYSYSPATGLQRYDSLRFIYSGGRGSQFDFDNLIYPYGNNADFPYAYTASGYVQYDTARSYATPSAPAVLALRAYNTGGKVLRSITPQEATFFTYNAQGRVSKTLTLSFDNTTMSYDTSYRDFYTYNASGALLRDSSEDYDPTSMSWMEGLVTAYTNNASGMPVQVDYSYFGFPYYRILVTYNGAGKYTRSISMEFNGTGYTMAGKDSVGYTGAMRIFYSSYYYDTSGVQHLQILERRRLNAASLPDSVWHAELNSSSGGIDTSIIKLGYNAQDAPVYRRDYAGKNPVVQSEQRWYYTLPTGGTGGVGVAGTATPARGITVYPNPAAGTLYLSGIGAGSYCIINGAGQIVQTGTVSAVPAVPLQALPPGQYMLRLQGEDGAVRAASFMKQ